MILLLLACNSSPVVTITAPEDGATLIAGATVLFTATLSDDHDAPDDLTLRWSSGDALLKGDEALDGGDASLSLAGQLAEGEVDVTLSATDLGGVVGRDSIQVNVRANQAPTVAFTAPDAGAVLPAGVPVTVQAQASDPDETDASVLSLSWTGLEAAEGPAHPDADGTASVVISPDVGEVSLSVTVSDAAAGFATALLRWTAIDADLDQDGFVDGGVGGDDCDDQNPAVHPGAQERCDGVDEDCDGVADNAPVNAPEWYRDNDADGHGAGSPLPACAQPAGWVPSNDDCNDNDAGIHPGATEICDAADTDCDGTVPTAEFTDADTDGYVACTDCADNSAAIHPGAIEVCDADNADEDCNGLADDNDPAATSQMLYYRDADGDGWGVASPTTRAQAKHHTVPLGFTSADGSPSRCSGQCNHVRRPFATTWSFTGGASS